MKSRSIRALMIPIEDLATINQNDTLLEAILALEKSQENVPAAYQQFRAMIVVDYKNDIVGKIGQYGLLKAFEPSYSAADNEIARLSTIDFDPIIIGEIMKKHELWKEDFSEIIKRAEHIRVRDIMSPVSESIDEYGPLGEAIHKLIAYQALALIVKKEDKVVGLLRLADIYDEVIRNVHAVFDKT